MAMSLNLDTYIPRKDELANCLLRAESVGDGHGEDLDHPRRSDGR
jgi:hypothetical protein